jgi:hypothetical protein
MTVIFLRFALSERDVSRPHELGDFNELRFTVGPR